jgi:hypothetical protein
LSIAQNWSTVTPWAHAMHEAIAALQHIGDAGGEQTGQHSPFGVTVIWSSLHLGASHLTAAHFEMHCPSTKIWFSSHSGLHPGVLSSSVAQNWATVTPWAHASHEAIIAKQQICGFGRQVGQHFPSGVTMIWSSLHTGSKHEAVLQSTGGFGGGKALQVGQHLPSSV